MNKKNNIDYTVVDKYNLTETELDKLSTAAALYADMVVDKSKDLVKWNSLYDKAFKKALEQIRPEIDEEACKKAFDEFCKKTQFIVHLTDINTLLYTVFKAGIEYNRGIEE